MENSGKDNDKVNRLYKLFEKATTVLSNAFNAVSHTTKDEERLSAFGRFLTSSLEFALAVTLEISSKVGNTSDKISDKISFTPDKKDPPPYTREF